MNTYTDCLVRCQPILGFCLAAGLIISPVETARSQSIVTDGDIVAGGISLQDLKEAHCDHLESLHAGSALPLFCTQPTPARFVFVTSRASTAGGDLVQWANDLLSPQTPFIFGLDAGDAICQEHADEAGLPGTYRAWLSVSGINNIDAKDRIGDHRWVLTDSTTVIADDLADLLNCNNPACLQNPINRTEFGLLAVSSRTYTGTTTTGELSSYACDNWYSDDGVITFFTGGHNTLNDSGWTDLQPIEYCNQSARLYCFGT
ncbi:MAG: hypothetical protein KJP16_07940 [Gammaproteobacteria bacterium]|nr:hypothetical protein [Gammaproteobacteria bacterium]NNC57130.1 hypothetical protein [Woeseiaceae bacterium]NNL50733.1 hypothetical protein [Woeseiaceae bacterium]